MVYCELNDTCMGKGNCNNNGECECNYSSSLGFWIDE